ncbi:MAG TPA: hypothetical protein VI197_13620 [Polyangiaceae bacterium]
MRTPPFRRVRAARVARRFPVVFQRVADGELHLTALTLLAPYLTDENHLELLTLAKHRTKQEVLRLVRKLDPQPTVRDRIEPLGPEPVGIPIPRAPDWRNFVESFAPGGRELAPGDSPKDWIDGADAARGSAPAVESERTGPSGQVRSTPADPLSEATATATHERYRVEFTASQEYVNLLERARDLLSHAVPNRSLEEVHLRALRLLVERLEKRKYGAPRQKRPVEHAPSESASTPAEPAESSTRTQSPEPSTSAPTTSLADSSTPPRAERSKTHAQVPRQRGAASVRREVRERDGLRCAFVDEFGQRCRETRFLELHHELAHALGGRETVRNLRMYCRAHNALAAEQDFGREFILERISGRLRQSR